MKTPKLKTNIEVIPMPKKFWESRKNKDGLLHLRTVDFKTTEMHGRQSAKFRRADDFQEDIFFQAYYIQLIKFHGYEIEQLSPLFDSWRKGYNDYFLKLKLKGEKKC